MRVYEYFVCEGLKLHTDGSSETKEVNIYKIIFFVSILHFWLAKRVKKIAIPTTSSFPGYKADFYWLWLIPNVDCWCFPNSPRILVVGHDTLCMVWKERLYKVTPVCSPPWPAGDEWRPGYTRAVCHIWRIVSAKLICCSWKHILMEVASPYTKSRPEYWAKR